MIKLFVPILEMFMSAPIITKICLLLALSSQLIEAVPTRRLIEYPYENDFYDDDFDNVDYLYLYESKPQNEDCSNFFDTMWICYSLSKNDQPYHVEIDEMVSIATTCDRTDSWALSFISGELQRPYEFCYDTPQASTVVYVVDTWLDIAHPEFQGRASRSPPFCTGNSHPHGTHVAGLVGGSTVGINKQAKIVGVQVLDDRSSAPWSVIIKGLEWVSLQKKGIINASIGGGKSEAVNRVFDLLSQQGFKVVVAAGNNNSDACAYTPASARLALTVAASDDTDRFSKFSNYGKCTDIIAPGTSVLSALPNRRLGTMSGTSMAAPLVAGVWSLYPELSKEDIIRMGGVGYIHNLPAQTPNVYVSMSDMSGLFVQ